jgi:N-acetylglucosaminyl-diphospho-decaprenol L-rhamnosyltransferase
VSPPPVLAAVVVNWNTCALLRQCLAALGPDATASARRHVICVDNGSSDGSAAMVRAEFPAVALIANAENRGFAAAANQGIALALEERHADYVALVNSDVIAPPHALASLVAHLESDPTVATVGPALRLADDRLQRGAAGYPLTAWSGVCQFLFLSALSGGRLHGFFLDSDRYIGTADPVAVDWVSGACMVVRADAIRRIGLLDERLFMYGEDVDWCLRMGRHGFAVRYAPATEVVHRQGASSAAASPRWLQSACELVRRERGPAEYLVFRTAAALGLGIRQLGYRLAYLASRHERYRRLAADMGVYAAWALGRR